MIRAALLTVGLLICASPSFAQDISLSDSCVINSKTGEERCLSDRAKVSCPGPDLFRSALKFSRQGKLANAERCYRKILSEAPNKYAQFNLAQILAQREQSSAEALRLFRDAAKAGSRYANYELGRRYYSGIGVTVDLCTSRHFLRTAKALGEERGDTMLRRTAAIAC